MDIKDSYLHGTVGVVKSISVSADKLKYKLADIAGTVKEVTLPVATLTANGLLSKEDKKKLDNMIATKVANDLILKIDSGTTEGTSLYTYNGSAAKTLDIKSGTGIAFSKTAGALQIFNSGVRSIATGTTNGTISVNTNGTSANVAVKGLGSAAYTTSGSYVQLGYLGSITDVVDLYSKLKPYFGDNHVSITKLKDERGIWGHLLSKFQNPDLGLYGVDGCGLFLTGSSVERWSIGGKNTTDDPLVYNKYKIYDEGNLGIVSSSANGLAPKVINTNTSTIGSAYYVLASTNGSATPSWYKLPANAFANDDTKVTQTNTTGNASYRVLFSGNNNDTTETTTARKSANLLFNPSTGNLTATSLKLNGNIIINDGTNNNRYIQWLHNNTDEYSWRIGYLGSGGANNNFLVFDSYREKQGWATALKFEHTTMIAHFGATVNAPTFQGNLDGTYVNKLTGYSKASSGSNVAATDTLNVALGKIEYKAHFAYEWITNVTASDTDEYINKWGEIVGFLDSVKEGTDILDEFVTRKTALTITGLKTLQSESSTTGVSLILKNNGWSGGMSTAMDFYNGRSYAVPNARISTAMNGDGRAGGTLIFYTQTKHASTNPNPNGLTERLRIDDNGLTKITGGLTVTSNITGAKFITSGGTSSLFVKGDGSLDSNKYLINTHGTQTSAYYRHTNVNGTDYAFWSPINNSGSFTIYAPSTAGTKNQVLLSNGSGAPVWSNSVSTANNGIFYIEGTGTTAGTWLGSHIGITSYYVGLTIAYKIPIAGASTTTLNINSLGAKTCYINTSKLTTHYGVGATAILVYDGTYFRAADYWDGNNYAKVRQYMYDSSNAEYPLLFRYATTATTTYVTDYTAYDSGITINPSTNNLKGINDLYLTGDISIKFGDSDKFVIFDYDWDKSAGGSWRMGALGSGSGDTNYFVVLSGTNTTSATAWNNVMRIGMNTYDIAISGNLYPLVNNTKTLGTSSLKWANVYATTFTGNLSGNATTATTANVLKATTVVSAKAFSLSNASWTDTSYTFASLATGTYAVQVTSGSNLVASGIMSVYKNLSDTAGDEIPLHVYGTAGWRPYLRTYNNKLLISSNDASATSRTVTIKIALIL